MRSLRNTLGRPEVVAPAATVVIVLLTIGTLLWWGPATGVIAEAYREHRDHRWYPGPWALTVDDFPTGTAQEIPVRQEWLEPRSMRDPEGPQIPVPSLVPGLEHLTEGQDADGLRPADQWDAATRSGGLATISGVRLGELEIYSAPLHHPEIVQHRAGLSESLAIRARRVPGSTPLAKMDAADLLVTGRPGLLDAAPLGDRITVTVTDHGGPPDVDIEGDRGWIGVSGRSASAGHEKPRQVAAVLAPVEGELVVLGITAPAGATVDWDAEIEPLVDLIERKMIAAPFDEDAA